jgi:flagellar basal-body rod protein FlgF
MDNSIYVGLSKQLGLQKQLEVVANNVANVGTTGFKRELMLYNELTAAKSEKGHTISFANEINTYVDQTNGPLKTTNRPLDIAIEGAGFFVVGTPLGERYTRAGNLILNNEGALSTLDQKPILSIDRQPIIIPPGAKNIVISQNGAVRVDGQELQTIAVIDFTNTALLENIGEGMFKSPIPPIEATKFKIMQGGLEESNVKSVQELTELIEVQRDSTLLNELVNNIGDLQRNTVQAIANGSK